MEPAMPSKDYNENDIKLLSDREHVRLRLPVYAGSTKITTFELPIFTKNSITLKEVSFVPATYKVVNEIIDNCVDEHRQNDITPKLLTIAANPILGTYTISDNGRGVPIGKHETGKYTPEVVFGSLRSGRNFTTDNVSGVIGQNGMGSSITNYCSAEFSVKITRDGKQYTQTFTDGASHISKPSINKSSVPSGTTISFQLDGDVFDETALPPELMENRAIEIALTNPGVTAEYNNTKYKFNNGFDDVVKKISNNYFKFETSNMEFFVIFDVHIGADEKMFTWVNSSLLFDGGICNTQFQNAFLDNVSVTLESKAKKNKCEIAKADIRKNLLILGNLKVSDPQYDAQSKTRLTGPNLRKEINELITSQWGVFTKKNKSWFVEVFDRAYDRHHMHANTKAIKDHQKNLKKKVPGLVDATSKNRFETKLLVTEGASAASMITEARNPKTDGSYPLTGKINNVFGSTVAQLLKMKKVTDLIQAIGLVPGQKAMRNDLRYGKLIIATDADFDGSDIMTLLVNLFFQFWPELFDKDYEPFIYRLVAPNVVAHKGGKRVHFTTRHDYEINKDKYKNWTFSYMKGLGSMQKSDWEIILANEESLIPFIDDGEMSDTLKLLFGESTQDRKEWLTHE